MNNPAAKFYFVLMLILGFRAADAQSYHALSGSPYAGVTGMYNNPASTANAAYKWDMSLLSSQITFSNSLFVVNQTSLLKYDSADMQFTNGLRSRYQHTTLDINLFNFRYNIDKNKAFAFALRGRTYNFIKTAPFYYTDTISTTESFLHLNKVVDHLEGYATNSGWIEADFNYSQVIQQNESSRLTGGITIGYMRGISGAHSNVQRLSYSEQTGSNNQLYYLLTGGAVTAEYSQNYDLYDSTKSVGSNVKSFIKNTVPAFNFNIGFEYLFKKQTEYDKQSLSPTNYDWKIGVSIMDIGVNKFNPANGSFIARNPVMNTSDTGLLNKLQNVGSIKELRDSLATVFTTIDSIASRFTIANPTRLIISVDKNLGHHFYINGELSVNFFSTQPQAKLKTRELNLLTITPRWETNFWGVYMPIQYNTQGQLWVGGAVKMGPLLLGFHSLDFYKAFKVGTQTFNGGLYLVLNIHPFDNKIKEAECPPF